MPRIKAADEKRHLGTYRADRAPRQRVEPSGEVTMPSGLDDDARAHWEMITTERANWLAASDQHGLELCCETWSMLCKVGEAYKRDLNNATVRNNYISLLNAWTKLSSRFGLTPSDRETLGVTKIEDERSKEIEKRYFG